MAKFTPKKYGGGGGVPQIFAKTDPLIGVPKGIANTPIKPKVDADYENRAASNKYKVTGTDTNTSDYSQKLKSGTGNNNPIRQSIDDIQSDVDVAAKMGAAYLLPLTAAPIYAEMSLNSSSEKPTSSEIIRGTNIKADHTNNDWMSLFGTSVNAQPYVAPGDTNKEIGQQGKTPEYTTQQNNMTDGKELFGKKKVYTTPFYYNRSGVFSSPEMLSFASDVLLSRYKPAYLNVKTGLNVAMDVFRNTEDGSFGIPTVKTLSNPHYYSAIIGDILGAELAKVVGRTVVTTGKYLSNNKGNYIGALKGTGKKLIKKDTYMPLKKSGKQTVAPDESEFIPAGNGPINQAAANTPNKFPTWKDEWKNAKPTSDYGRLYSMNLEGDKSFGGYKGLKSSIKSATNPFVTAALLGANVMMDQGLKGKLPSVVKQIGDNVYNTGKSFVEEVNEKLTNYKNQ